MDVTNDQERQIQHLRKFALVLSFTSFQVLILFPLLVCSKLYFFPELHWSWLIVTPQIAATFWLFLIPYSRIRLLGFFLLTSPAFVGLGIQSTGTYWGCHASLFPFFFGLLGGKKFPLGLVLSSQLHLETILVLFNNTDLVEFPFWHSGLGIITFFLICFGTILLPLAVLSVAYLVQQTSKSIVAVTTAWILLCVLLSLNAVKIIQCPIFVYASLLGWIGLCLSLDGLMVFVSWRSRLTGIVWPFITEPVPIEQTQRTTRQRVRGLTNREISELPILVINCTNRDVPFDSLCTICQDFVMEGHTAILLPACHHVFHPPCVIQWLKRKSVCPNCNLDVRDGLTSTRAPSTSTELPPTSRRSTATRLSSLMGAFMTGGNTRPTRPARNTRPPQTRFTDSRQRIGSRRFGVGSQTTSDSGIDGSSRFSRFSNGISASPEIFPTRSDTGATWDVPRTIGRMVEAGGDSQTDDSVIASSPPDHVPIAFQQMNGDWPIADQSDHVITVTCPNTPTE